MEEKNLDHLSWHEPDKNPAHVASLVQHVEMILNYQIYAISGFLARAHFPWHNKDADQNPDYGLWFVVQNQKYRDDLN